MLFSIPFSTMRSTSFSFVACLAASASAFHLPFRRTNDVTRVQKRQSAGNDLFNFQNIHDNLYVGTIFVDGNPFVVQLDTGSSDLWIDTTNVVFASATNSNITGYIAYLDQSVATGPILISNVTFGNWTVPDQAFISAPGSNATAGGADKGLLGVGPPGLSSIHDSFLAAKSSYDGSSFLDRVFNAYPSFPDHITFALSRDEVGITAGGVFTISTIQPGYEKISSMPKLEVLHPLANLWQTALSGILVNGTLHQGGSAFEFSNNYTSAILDTGTSAALAPKAYVDAFYANVPGAQYDTLSGTWYFPCDQAYFNVSFIFANEYYFVHPIDMSQVYSVDKSGAAVCTGSFSFSPDAGADFLLGDSFLRNVYSLYNFGNWTTASSSTPFMQLLAVTDEATAFSEFQSLNHQRIQAFSSTSSSSGSVSLPSSTSSAGNTYSHLSTGSSASTSLPSASLPSTITSSTGLPSSSSLSVPSGSSVLGNKDLVAGALASNSPNSVDLSPVNRNSYIIMGLIGIAIILLAVNLATTARKNKGYKEIGALGSAPHSYSD